MRLNSWATTAAVNGPPAPRPAAIGAETEKGPIGGGKAPIGRPRRKSNTDSFPENLSRSFLDCPPWNLLLLVPVTPVQRSHACPKHRQRPAAAEVSVTVVARPAA